MTYDKTTWKDLIRDDQGNILQSGTPITAEKLNKIEDGIGQATADLAQIAIQVKGIGNGTADDTQAFVDALASSSIVYVPRGKTYLVGNVDVTGKRIFGGGTIKKKSTSQCAFHVKGDGAVIEGLKFLGESTSGQPNVDIKLGDGSKNIVIQNCVFNSPIYSAISGAIDSSLVGGGDYINKAEGVLITNNIFKGYARPIYLHSVSNMTISNNIIRDTSFDAIRLRENDGFCLINGNQFINIGMKDLTYDVNGNPVWIDEQTRDAIDTYWSGKELTISNNIIKKTAYHGFDLKGVSKDGAYNSSKVIVTNNQIYQTRYSGICVMGDSDTNQNGVQGDFKAVYGYLITGNIVQECNQNNKLGTGSIADSGIKIKQIARFINIADNFVCSNYSRGIYVHNGSSLAETGANAQTRSIKISGNMCVNNGYSGVFAAGIHVAGISYAIINQNICENDIDIPNSNVQAYGIYIHASDNGFTATERSIIVRDNICRHNTSIQILCDSNTTRINSIALFDGNLEEGTNANYRGAWQHQRRVLFGSTIPSAGEGIFKRGDTIYNVAPIASGKIGWICVADGNPGTWRAFGAIDA